jgi:hypothetical protein
MNYLVSKSDSKYEYRIYKNDNSSVDGTIIYKGHKLGVEKSLLSEILFYKIERSTGKIFHYDYSQDEMKESSSIKNLFESWNSLIGKISDRKILISKINI